MLLLQTESPTPFSHTLRLCPARIGTVTKPRPGKNKFLIDFKALETDTGKVTDIDEILSHKLNTGQDEQKEEPLKVTELLVLPPSALTTVEDTNAGTNEGLMEVEVKLQGEQEKFEMYNRIYVGLLSKQEDSNTKTDKLMYTYFG